MKDEIKEILDYLNKFINDKEEITKYGCEISVKQAKQLLDYITNLQDKYKEADYDRHKLFEAKEKLQNDYQEAVDKITNLQEENKRLNNKTKRLNSKIKLLEHNCKQAEDSCRQHRLANKNKKRRLQRREEQINLYKTRNEKAIEYMKTLYDEYADNDYDIKCNVFNKLYYEILQGKSDE